LCLCKDKILACIMRQKIIINQQNFDGKNFLLNCLFRGFFVLEMGKKSLSGEG
jgi:hypothetical protein